VGQNLTKGWKDQMWLEETIWIWAPVLSAALTWFAFRLNALGHELSDLRMRVAQLEDAAGYAASSQKSWRAAA
jgi:hypothetical protein